MPLLSIKGRNEVRQGSFQALSGTMLNGPWAQAPGSGVGFGGTAIAFGKAPGDAAAKPAPGAPPATTVQRDG